MKKLVLLVVAFMFAGCVNLAPLSDSNATQEQRDLVYQNANTIISIAYCVANPKSTLCAVNSNQSKSLPSVKFKVAQTLDINGSKVIVLKEIKDGK